MVFPTIAFTSLATPSRKTSAGFPPASPNSDRASAPHCPTSSRPNIRGGTTSRMQMLSQYFRLRCLVPGEGLEPPTRSSSGFRYYQLSYPGMVKGDGVEPSMRVCSSGCPQPTRSQERVDKQYSDLRQIYCLMPYRWASPSTSPLPSGEGMAGPEGIEPSKVGFGVQPVPSTGPIYNTGDPGGI